MPEQNAVELVVVVSDTIDLHWSTYPPNHDYDRLGVSLEQLRAEIASMVDEIRERLALVSK